MKIKKEIDKEIIILIIESILITVIIIWIATLIGKWMLNNRRNVYVSNEVVVDIDSKIKGKLPVLSDLDGLTLEGNKIILTNNSNLEKNYQILLCGDNNNASDIRLSFNKEYIKSLNKFSYNNSCYEIINSILKPYTNNEFYVSIWQKKSNNIDNIKVNYTLKVNIK